MIPSRIISAVCALRRSDLRDRPGSQGTAGLRYFHYGFDYTQNYSGLATAPPYVSSGSTSASGFTPKFGISYLPTPDLTLFADAAKGFRPGSANLPIPPSFCGVDLQSLGANTYRPDSGLEL